MKITPLAGPTSAPGTALGTVEVTRSASPDRMERAKAIAAGADPTQALPEQKDPQLERPDARRIKMKVNRTPLSQPVQQVETATEEPQALTESSIPDNTSNAPAEATQPLSPLAAQLAREKQAVRQERAEIARLKAEIEAARGNLQPNNFEAELKADPLGALQKYGITYEQLTEAVLADPSNKEINALREEIKALREGFDKTLNDRDAAQEAQVLSEIRKEADRLVSSSDEFELVKSQRAVPHAVELIKRTFKQTGEILSTEEALQEVENILLEDATNLAKLKKVQSKIAPPPQPQPVGEKQMRTLTARDTATRPMTAKERALAAFHGTLKR